MIFAAGLGTRLRPLTENMPKALVPVGGKTMLERVIQRLKIAGCTHIVVNIHHFGQQIIDFLQENRNFGLSIDISDERDGLLDTGGGIRKAAHYFSGKQPVLIYNVDILSNLDLTAFYTMHCRSASQASLLVAERNTSRYLLFDARKRLCGWENKKTDEVKSPYPEFSPEKYTAYAFGGIHVISPELLQEMQEREERFSIIDFYLSVADKMEIKAYPAPEGLLWMDLGKVESLKKAEEILQNSL